MIVLPPVFNSGDTVYCFFDSYDSAGASVSITGLAVTDIEIYKNGSTTQRTSDNGYTLLDTDGIDFDGAVGLNGFSVDTSDNSDAGFWADGAQYLIHVNAVTIDGQTVRFSYMLTLGYLLRPTTTGRKLDVSSGGEAGLDWANVGSPTTTQTLSGTTVKTATDVETDTQDIQSRLPAALTAGGNMKSDMLALNGGTQSAADLRDFADDGYDPATNKVQGVVLVDTTTSLGTDAVNDASFADGLVTQIQTGLATSSALSTVGTDVSTVLTRIGTPTNLGSGANLSANLVDVESQTDDIGAAGAGLTAIPWNSAWDAEVQSEVEDGLVVHRLDELLNADSDIDGAAPPAVGSVFHELMSKTTGSFTFDRATDSLEAVRDRGDAAWITAVGFSTLTQADIRTATGLASANLDTQLSGIQADLPVKLVANTAYSGFPFVMVDSSDAPLTGLTVTAQRSLDGGAFVACANSPVEVSSGLYKIDLAAADTNASNFVTLKFSATGAKTRFVVIVVQRT